MKLESFLNQESIEKLNDSNLHKLATPFPHIVIDDFLKDDVANELDNSFPSFTDNIWYEYNNPIEKKLASDDIRKFPPLFAKVIHSLNSQSFLDKLERLTGISNLFSDPYLHGGGLHCSKNGGKLDIHLDYAIHPKLKMERRINLILYIAKDWKEEFGGFLELWNSDISKCEKRVIPQFNRAVIFNTDEVSFHGHPDPIICPENLSRNSIALYYLTEPRKQSSNRPRARFYARPSDPMDAELEEFRAKRSSVSGVY